MAVVAYVQERQQVDFLLSGLSHKVFTCFASQFQKNSDGAASLELHSRSALLILGPLGRPFHRQVLDYVKNLKEQWGDRKVPASWGHSQLTFHLASFARLLHRSFRLLFRLCFPRNARLQVAD